jgi:hypothetical protein
LLLTFGFMVRLLPTSATFSGTYDEPFQIAAGMEGLDKGSYTSELVGPPFAGSGTSLDLRWRFMTATCSASTERRMMIFPLVLAVKTPMGFLLLSAGGLVAALLKANGGSWQRHLTRSFRSSFYWPSSIDSDVRRISPIYAPLAVLGGYAAARLVKDRSRRWMPAAGLLLVASVVAESVIAPDYMAYFNPIPSAHPENILFESDLEWGICSASRHGCGSWAFPEYFGTTRLERPDLPTHEELSSAFHGGRRVSNKTLPGI